MGEGPKPVSSVPSPNSFQRGVMEELSDADKRELRQWCLSNSGSHRLVCPNCSSGRKGLNVKAKVFTVTIEPEYAKYRCWHCEVQGGISLRGNPMRDLDRPYVPEPPRQKEKGNPIKTMGTGLDPLAIAFLKGRGISEATALHFGLTWCRAYFPDLQRETHGVAYPYIEDRKVKHKVRSTEDKAHICRPAVYSLFGLQHVDLDESGDLIICEGEPDALAMYEAGVINPTSVPNGASSFTQQQGDDPRVLYGFLWSAKEKIDKAKRIIIATDDDDPGKKLAEEIARRIGRHRCWRVSYPEGCKDANEVLIKAGKAALKECVAKAEPWPVEGIYEAITYADEVFKLFDEGHGERILTGITPVDEYYSVAPGLLTVVTGIPGNGKSTLVDQFMINLARQRGQVFAICSFENPPHVHIGKLAQMLLQKNFFDNDIGVKMTREELDGVLPFINKHFKFLHQDDGRKATIESVIERIKTAVFRWGIHGAVIDPYNYIQRPKGAESETQWIDDMLTQLRLTAAAHGIHLWFVAHPTKLQSDADGNYPPPKGYSISGSAAWYAKADFGLTIHRVPDQPGVVEFHNWKTRFDWLGKNGSCRFLFNNQTHVYMSDVIDMPMEPVKKEATSGFSKPRLVYAAARDGDDDDHIPF